MDFLNTFKMLSDETRIRILNLLIDNKLCVCEIEAILGITQSNASRHLNKLKTVKIIESAKDSQWTYYKVHDDFIKNNAKLYEYLKAKLKEDEVCSKDSKKLARYSDSSFTRSDMRENKDTVVQALEISCCCKKNK